MDIKQAVERVEHLLGQIESLDKAIAKTEELKYGLPCEVRVRVFVDNHGTRDVIAKRDEAIELLTGTRNHYQAEVDRLKPVIDMANAALKGLEK